MTTSTQAMNNVSKVQTQSNTGKPKQNIEQVELNFNDLFSSALGQKAPTAQLNSIESQLRESLFKQDNKANRKNTESNSNAEAAQAAVWAQRDWMQQAKVPQVEVTAPPAASTGNNAMARTKETVVDQPKSASNLDSKANEPVNSTPTQTDNTDTAPTAAAPESTAQASAPAPATSTVPVAAETAMIAEQSALNQPATDARSDTSGKLPAEVASTELLDTETTAQASADAARPQDKSTGHAKVDTVLSNSTVQVRADQQTAAATGNPGNTNAVAAQLAPQIAQQAQNMAESFEVEGLKVGQKILAGGSLQAAGTHNGIAAGTNGLNGTLGNAPQALIKTPVTQPGFAKEIGQTVQWAIGKNLSTVDIRVNPETFGPMNMRLVQKGQQVQLVIRTQDESSANLLTQALGGLKEVLAQNGLQLNQVQIQHGNTNTPNGQGNQSQAQFDQQSQGQNRGGQQSGNSGSSEQDSATGHAQPSPARKAEGKLDLFA